MSIQFTLTSFGPALFSAAFSVPEFFSIPRLIYAILLTYLLRQF